MIHVLKEHKVTFILYGSILVTGTLLLAAVPKLQLHTWLNQVHTGFRDRGFEILTLLGDGWFALGFSVFLLFIRFRYAFMMGSSSLVSGILVQFTKRVIFPDAMRPAAFIEDMPELELVRGIDLHYHFSFPSGHTATAFAVLVLAGLISDKRSLAFTGMLLAWSVGFSRVYLSQHFLSDVLAGSVMGLLSALFFYWYFKLINRQWLDQSLMSWKNIGSK